LECAPFFPISRERFVFRVRRFYNRILLFIDIQNSREIAPKSSVAGMERMFAGSQVFVDIDTQRDFLEPSGALFVPGSEAIVRNLARLTRCALLHQIPILATACAHGPGDLELLRFPPHCMAGTPGQERVDATRVPETTILAFGSAFSGDLPPHLTLEKRDLDFFTHPAADGLIARYNSNRPIFVIYGVATDYCVKAAVQGLLDRHCRVALVVDAIRAIDKAAEPAILTEFAGKHVLLTITAKVCNLKSWIWAA
jgi:nicotinamidase/pyrazinamidase